MLLLITGLFGALLVFFLLSSSAGFLRLSWKDVKVEKNVKVASQADNLW